MTSSGEPKPSGRLEDKAVQGVTWTVLVFASSKAITFVTTLVLARLLVPEDFGLVALATVTIGTLSLVSDLGLGGALVVRKDLDRRTLGTILTLMLVMGAVTALVIAALSPVAASVFGEPRLGPVLAVLASTALLGVPTWFYGTILQRELEFWRRFKCQLAQSLTYAGVAISSAAAGAGVWSIVAGQLSGTLVFAVALLYMAPYRVRPAFERQAARETLREGRGFVAQAGVSYVELNADYLTVGSVLGATPLGYYSMAFRLGELPYRAVTEPVAKVTFPGFARISQRGESVTGAFLSVLGLVALVASPLGVLLSATADPFTRAILGDEWIPMIGVLAIFGIWGTLNHVEASVGWLMNSLGRAGLNAAISAIAVVPLVLGIVAAGILGSITTVAWVLLAHGVGSTVVRMGAAHRSLEVPLGRQWRTIRPVVLGSIVAWGVARAVVEITTGAPTLVSLVASLLAGAGAYATVISLAEPGALPRSASQLRRVLRPAPSA